MRVMRMCTCSVCVGQSSLRCPGAVGTWPARAVADQLTQYNCVYILSAVINYYAV